MATSTQARLRELLARGIGFYFSGTATGGSASTIADTSADSFDALEDAVTTGMWAHITDTTDDAAPEGETRRVTSVSTSTLTVTNQDYSAVVAASDTYELLPYHTTQMNDAIREAVRTVPLDILYLPLRDQTITVDDRLSNGTFEVGGADVFTGWTKTAGTWTEEATIIFEGARSAKGVASGADAQLTQAWQGTIAEIAGQTALFRLHMQAIAANVARVGIDFGNSIAVSYSSYHTGKSAATGIGQWEPLEVTVAVPAEAASITGIAEVADGNTAYVDWGGGLRVGQIDRYTIPTAFVNVPYRVLMMANDDQPDGRYLPITSRNRARENRLLRLEGKGHLTVPTAESSTVEIDESQAMVISALAARILFNTLANTDPSKRAEHERRRDYWRDQYAERITTFGVRMGSMPADLWTTWGGAGITEDSSGRYLTLKRAAFASVR